ncbi:SH3 domain-containing protein [Gemmata sp. G18]|uniref:SH3 domain-containing protein n=1 Tax=Gemmata palustris TaxID=2822762 RepID=A0ABS5BPV8_9BACT|nr:SH3 domain-containing protein [Gemmata palustris]MBP3955761.1 SH3 domain-containing protein [Gemmata palustris]
MLRAALAGLTVALFAAHATAQPAVYKATVVAPEVKLRAGASDQFPDTGTLRQGTPVIVEREAENGWLAVTAPQGSISWVQAQFINDYSREQLTDEQLKLPPKTPRNVFVETDGEITIATGKVGSDEPFDIRRVKLPPGTELVVIGQKASFAGKSWYPITPPHGDVRYIPKTAVQFEKAVNAGITVRVNENVTPIPPGGSGSPSVVPATPAGGPLAAIPGPGVTPTAGTTASKPAVNHPLWEKAEAAERENRLKDAVDLYFQLAGEINRTGGDHEIANQCFSRVHDIRGKQRDSARGSTTAPTMPTSLLKPPTKEDRAVRPGTPEPLPPAANTNGAKDERVETQSGTLARSNLTPPGLNRQLYILESPSGEPKMYVTSAPGVNLAQHLGRRVEVTGSTTTAYGLKRPCLVATSIDLAP